MPNTAIITGAASGIGLEAARDLLAKGWVVHGVDVSATVLTAAAETLASDRFHPHPCDLRDADAIVDAIGQIREKAPAINALICSAGIARIGPLATMSLKNFDNIFGVNVRGLWLTCRETYPALKQAASDGGLARVIILSSVSAIRPKIDSGAYAASKAAASQLTQVLAVEWAGDGILVNALAPGTVDTPMIRSAADPAKQGNWRPSGDSPLGRVAEAIDIVRVMRFLLSDDAVYVTGTIIPVDGGTRAAFVPKK